jgi:hypothetical protein
VSTTHRALTVNGVTMDVRGEAARTEVAQALQACGRPEAARAFDAWRRLRRTGDIAAYTLIGYYPLGIGIVAHYSANRWRERTERLLLDPGVADEEGGRGWRKKVR